jgi:hypothetical protein
MSRPYEVRTFFAHLTDNDYSYRDRLKERLDRQEVVVHNVQSTGLLPTGQAIPGTLDTVGGPAAEADRERKEEKRRRKEEERRRRNEERMRTQAKPGSIWEQIRTGRQHLGTD